MILLSESPFARNKQPPRRLLDRVRDVAPRKHYSIRNEGTYINWIRRYILFHDKRQPIEMGVPEIEAFLTHFAVDENVTASTQTRLQARCCFSTAKYSGWSWMPPSTPCEQRSLDDCPPSSREMMRRLTSDRSEVCCKQG